MLTNSVFGQFVGKDNLSVALFYMQKSELDSAKKYIDLSIQEDTLASSPKKLYYRGFIYKELYKTIEKDNKTSTFRLVAIESFTKLLTLNVDTNEFSESGVKILNYLATTLYNDAARLLDPDNYQTAIVNYENYRNTMFVVNPNVDLRTQDAKFKLALASMLNRPAETEKGLDSAQANQIEKLYLEVIAIDPNNPGANYNLAILYYNEAADIINNMDYDMDIEKLNEVQDHCIEIFLQALPYMKKSYELNYKRKETLIGLSNIYYGLNDMEKSDSYKAELEYLEAGDRYIEIKIKIKELEDKGLDSTKLNIELKHLLINFIKKLEVNGKTNSDEYQKYKTELQNLLNKYKDLEKEK